MSARTFAGPLRAKSRRGAIGETWWSRTLIDLLEASSIGGRLQRGKNYARQGRVLEMSLEPGRVNARVQGSEPEPYSVILTFCVFGEPDVEALIGDIARAPFLVAALAAGTLPEELNQVAERLDVRLLPAGPADLRFSCTCPDWGEPCKHASAVTYLVAEHLDAEPFDLLTLHGVDRAALIEAVVAATASTSHQEDDGEPAIVGSPAAPPSFFAPRAPFPLPAEPPSPASALEVLDHRLLTPRGPSIAYWLSDHYARLAASAGGPNVADVG